MSGAAREPESGLPIQDGMPPRRLDVLILTHYFPPEVGAPQSRLGFLARFLVRRGHRVEVLASLPSYPTGIVPGRYRRRFLIREEWEGAHLVRTWTYARPGHSFLRRLANYLSFSVTCLAAMPAVRRPDVILVESPPLFLALSAVLWKYARRTRLVIHVSDLWVKAATKFGYLSERSRTHGILQKLESFGHRSADAVIVVSQGMIEELASEDCPTGKIRLIPNGVDTEVFHPRHDGEAIRKSLGLQGKFLVIFAGTHGHVTDMAVLLGAAHILRDLPEVHFLFVGDGVEKEGLMRAAREENLSNMTFLGAQPEPTLAGMICGSHVGVNTLKPVEFTEHIISVKVFSYMACGIPVVTTSKQALREIVEQSGAGLLVREGDPAALADAIRELYRDEERRLALGEAGARWVARTYSRQIAGLKTERLFLEQIEGA